MKAATFLFFSFVFLLLLFQSTPPVKAATRNSNHAANDRNISIHAAREGGDPHVDKLPKGRLCISIHAAREGGDLTSAGTFIGQTISIHAAREGGDPLPPSHAAATPAISIHAAREGGDTTGAEVFWMLDDFNPRRP